METEIGDLVGVLVGGLVCVLSVEAVGAAHVGIGLMGSSGEHERIQI
jgi:hypothetical protein